MEESNNSTNQLIELQKKIEDYCTSRGLPDKSKLKINATLDYDEIQLLSMSEEECAIQCVILARYSLYLQAEENRQNTIRIWCEENIKRKAAPNLNNYRTYKYATYNETLSLVVNDNEYLKNLDNIRIQATLRCSEIKETSRKIEFLCKTIDQLRMSKRKKMYD